MSSSASARKAPLLRVLLRWNALAYAVIGGLLLSTVITLVLTPLVFTFVYELREAVARRLGFQPAVVGETAAAEVV